jgi:hypothetical protein
LKRNLDGVRLQPEQLPDPPRRQVRPMEKLVG